MAWSLEGILEKVEPEDIPETVVDELKKLYKGKLEKEGVANFINYVTKCFNPETPSHELYLSGVNIAYINNGIKLSKRKENKVSEIVKYVNNVLYKKGYRNDIQTTQELKLLGTGDCTTYADRPYIPIGVLKGELTIAEAKKARELEKKWAGLGLYFGEEEMVVKISLEPLNEKGETTADPVRIDQQLNKILTTYSANFPFRRAE